MKLNNTYNKFVFIKRCYNCGSIIFNEKMVCSIDNLGEKEYICKDCYKDFNELPKSKYNLIKKCKK